MTTPEAAVATVFQIRAGNTSPAFWGQCSCGWNGSMQRYPQQSDPEGDDERANLSRSEFVVRGAAEVEGYSTDKAKAARCAAAEDLQAHIRGTHA